MLLFEQGEEEEEDDIPTSFEQPRKSSLDSNLANRLNINNLGGSSGKSRSTTVRPASSPPRPPSKQSTPADPAPETTFHVTPFRVSKRIFYSGELGSLFLAVPCLILL